jgi:hypothetical protein
MPNCKQCGTKYSLWSSLARNDGLCKDCGGKADEDAKQQAQIKETERKNQVLEDARSNIDLILEAMTPEAPLCCTFVSWDIAIEGKGGLGDKLPGLLLGAAVGGAVGEMVFGGTLLSKSSVYYPGQLGVLVLTPSEILIGHCKVPFESQNGRISPQHLQFLREQLTSNTIVRKAFDVSRSYVMFPDSTDTSSSCLKLVCGTETMLLRMSELYVNDEIYELPSAVTLHNQIRQLGSLPTPTEFTAKLLLSQNPLSETQQRHAREDVQYLSTILNAIVAHHKRDVLVQNFACLAPSIRSALEAHIRTRASTYRTQLNCLILSALLAMTGIVMSVVVPTEHGQLLSLVLFITGGGSSWWLAERLRRTIWFRTISASESAKIK